MHRTDGESKVLKFWVFFLQIRKPEMRPLDFCFFGVFFSCHVSIREQLILQHRTGWRVQVYVYQLPVSGNPFQPELFYYVLIIRLAKCPSGMMRGNMGGWSLVLPFCPGLLLLGSRPTPRCSSGGRGGMAPGLMQGRTCRGGPDAGGLMRV